MTRREDGFAVLAAMIAAAAFAALAVEITASSRAAVVSATADARRAREQAAASAGFAIALAGLQDQDAGARWTIDGAPRTLDYDDLELHIRVEDEWGKIPLNTLTRGQARAMFAAAGAADADALAAAFLAARHDPGTAGAQGDATPGFSSLSELKSVPGMTPAIYAAIASAATVFARDAAFEPRTAAPLALEVMTGAAPGSPEVLERARALNGETTALDVGPPLKLAGRPLTLRVEVTAGDGARLKRAEVVELTRAASRPYIVRGFVEPGPVS